MNSQLPPSFSPTEILVQQSLNPGPRRIASTLALRRERIALVGFLLLVLLALLGPSITQPAHYHQFADQRAWGPLPFAMDVLSNLAFALWAVLAAWYWARLDISHRHSARGYASVLFLAGLWLTTLGSAWYHLAPDNAGLLVDRAAMTVAFAGLVALGFAERVSARSSVLAALAVLLGGGLALYHWTRTGELLPWAVVQGGGMLVLLTLAALPPESNKPAVNWLAVIVIYALAKLCEAGDQFIFHWSDGWISGHTLKHLIASCAALPVVLALRASTRQDQDSSLLDRATDPASNPP